MRRPGIREQACVVLSLLGIATLAHAGSIGYSGYLDEKHPVVESIGIPLWDEIELAISVTYPDGTFWVRAGDDNRIRSGTWRLGADGRICLIVGGVYEGCGTSSREGNLFKSEVPEAGITFIQELRPGLQPDFPTDLQKKLYRTFTTKRGAIETGRGGDEHVYWHNDGLVHVVAPNGSIKAGAGGLRPMGKSVTIRIAESSVRRS
ncbi:MAG TPA: hypothetical protein EYG08_09580 [Myxococcales bacterium]|nr:hypothetical protein [Myxococcales bacterium]